MSKSKNRKTLVIQLVSTAELNGLYNRILELQQKEVREGGDETLAISALKGLIDTAEMCPYALLGLKPDSREADDPELLEIAWFGQNQVYEQILSAQNRIVKQYEKSTRVDDRIVRLNAIKEVAFAREMQKRVSAALAELTTKAA